MIIRYDSLENQILFLTFRNKCKVVHKNFLHCSLEILKFELWSENWSWLVLVFKQPAQCRDANDELACSVCCRLTLSTAELHYISAVLCMLSDSKFTPEFTLLVLRVELQWWHQRKVVCKEVINLDWISEWRSFQVIIREFVQYMANSTWSSLVVIFWRAAFMMILSISFTVWFIVS